VTWWEKGKSLDIYWPSIKEFGNSRADTGVREGRNFQGGDHSGILGTCQGRIRKREQANSH